MSRDPFPTTQMQNLWKQAIEKESRARLAAFQRLRGKPRTISNEAEVYRKRLELNKSALIKIVPPEIEEITYNRKNANRVCKNRLYQSLKDDDEPKEINLNGMRPVSPLVKATLYEGYSRIGQGRKHFLRERYRNNPEDKFNFPIVSSWEYGWRLNDVLRPQDQLQSIYAHYEIMKKNFYRRNGLGLTESKSCNQQ